MTKPILCALLSFMFSMNIYAQPAAVKLESDVKPDDSVEIKYVKSDPGTYTILLSFMSLQNAGSDKKPLRAKGRSGRLLTLRPISKDQSKQYNYQYSFIRGELNPKVDSNFVYHLPYPEGTMMDAFESVFFKSKYFGDKQPDDWKVYRFYTEEPTLVTAVRKGIVVERIDLYPAPLDDVTFTT